jgi:hypothetical protein
MPSPDGLPHGTDFLEPITIFLLLLFIHQVAGTQL